MKLVFPLKRILALRMLLLFGLLNVGTDTFSQGVVPTMGTEFWLGYMANSSSFGTAQLDVFITGNTPTTGVVSMPLTGWSQPFTVVPNVTTTVTVPGTAMHQGSEVIENLSVLVQSADTVAVYAINLDQFTGDGSTVLPVQSLGTDYMVHAYSGTLGFSNLASEFLIVATQDNTVIEINSTANTVGGNIAGVPWTIMLDSAETYQVIAQDALDQFTGTTIVGTQASGACRPFAVFSGSVCAQVPIGCPACDHIVQQNLPTSVWGTRYFSVPFSSTNSYTYQILGLTNGTQITTNAGAAMTINAGQFIELNSVSNAVCFEGTAPFSVAQLMEGGDVSCGGNGDPALLILNSDDQEIDNITFATVPSTIITSHYVNIITGTPNINQVFLDGALIPAAQFTTFPSCPSHSYASVLITAGSHNLNCAGGLSAYCYGTGNAESYAYSTGSFTPVPPLIVDSVVCGMGMAGSVTLAPPIPINNPQWTTLSDPNTVLSTSLSYMFTPTTSDVYVVTGGQNLSGCEVQYLFSVEVDTPPLLTPTANGQPPANLLTVCAGETVQLDVLVNPPGTYIYNWSPGAQLNNANVQDPIAAPTQTTWYQVSVSTLNGCGVAVDSVLVNVVGASIFSFEAEADNPSLCLGDSSQMDLEVQQVLIQDTLDGVLGVMWQSVQGGVISNACGALVGDALYFDGPNPRIATTNGYDVSAGGTISCVIMIANGVTPCDDTEPGDNVILEYSVNGGGNWTLMETYWESLYPTFATVNSAIPAAAQTVNTMFRWQQVASDGAGTDNWSLDNVTIAVIDPTGFTFDWTPAGVFSSATAQNPMAYPTVTGWYQVEGAFAGTNCLYVDSVFIERGAPFNIAVTNDTAVELDP